MSWTILLLIISLISFIQDQLTTNCKHVTIETILLSLFHHFFSCWLFFGPFIGFTNYSLHLLVLITIVASWKYYGVCLWTAKYNELCGIQRKTNHRDLVYRFVKFTGISHETLAFFLICWDIYNIYLDK